MTESKTCQTQRKSLKARNNNNLTFHESTTHGATKYKNKICEVYNIIIEEKSYTFENNFLKKYS